MANTLRVTLSAVGQPCMQDPTPPAPFPAPGQYAFLLDCNGQPLVKAGREYGPVAFRHGYAEFDDVPQGRHLILVMTNPFGVGGTTFQSNFVAFGIVDACGCCDTDCAVVYQTGWHHCFTTTVLAARFLGRAQALDPGLVARIVEPLQEALKVGEAPGPERELLRLVEGIAGEFMTPATRG
jgi:hypothetical protein